MSEQFYFTAPAESKEFLRALRAQYPHASTSKLVRWVFVLGERQAQQDPKALQQVAQEDQQPR